MRLRDEFLVAAPAETVWKVFSDVEHWPDWTASVRRVAFLEGDAIKIGARVEIDQPKLRRAEWKVTSYEPGRSWSWESRIPGSTTTANHVVTPVDNDQTRVVQELAMTGVVGGPASMLYRSLIRRYVRMEAEGLTRTCESLHR